MTPIYQETIAKKLELKSRLNKLGIAIEDNTSSTEKSEFMRFNNLCRLETLIEEAELMLN